MTNSAITFNLSKAESLFLLAVASAILLYVANCSLNCDYSSDRLSLIDLLTEKGVDSAYLPCHCLTVSFSVTNFFDLNLMTLVLLSRVDSSVDRMVPSVEIFGPTVAWTLCRSLNFAALYPLHNLKLFVNLMSRNLRVSSYKH